MNIKQITGICVVVVFALTLSSVAIGADQSGRLPPGVQKYPDQQRAEQSLKDMLVVYTNDDSGKVSDFYRKTLHMDPAGEGKFLLGTDASRQDGRPAHTDAYLWLNIYPASETLDDKDLFGFLQGEIMVKKIRSEQELQQVKRKYAHLSKAWYPDFDVKAKLKSCQESAHGALSTKRKGSRRNKEKEREMVAQIQAMMAQGRHREAGQMAQQSARPGMQTGRAIQQENETDHWDEWIACLDEVNRHDYQTKIVIDLVQRYFRPSTEAERSAEVNQGSQSNQERSAPKPQRESPKGSNKFMGKDIGDIKKMFNF